MEFSTTIDYKFIGPTYLIEEMIENNYKENIYNLGKFICYIAIPMAGEIYDQGKALFENGKINANDFKYVVNII